MQAVLPATKGAALASAQVHPVIAVAAPKAAVEPVGQAVQIEAPVPVTFAGP